MGASQIDVTTKKPALGVTVSMNQEAVTFSVLHGEGDICSDRERRVTGLCLPSRTLLSADTETTVIRAAFVSLLSFLLDADTAAFG